MVENEEKTGPDWLDTVHNSCCTLRNNAEYLLQLSDSADVLGLKGLADDLEGLSKSISRRTDVIHDAMGQMTTEMLHRTQEATQNVVNAALAGVFVGMESAEDIDEE